LEKAGFGTSCAQLNHATLILKEASMSRINLRKLIDQGRKAGLQTSEIYGALVTSRPEGNDQALGRTDENGFVSTFDHGQRAYIAHGSHTRRS
jgi:hypothetical protein